MKMQISITIEHTQAACVVQFAARQDDVLVAESFRRLTPDIDGPDLHEDLCDLLSSVPCVPDVDGGEA